MAYRDCDICGGRHLTHKTRRGGRKPVAISEREMRRRCLRGGRRQAGQLDLALYAALEKRDENRCQKCGVLGSLTGSERTLDPSHVIRRSDVGRMVYDLPNVLTLCARCHRGWWHRCESEAHRWFASTWPNRMEWLDARVIECRALGGTIELAWYEEQLRELREFALQ